jgi:hypothetical protein
MDREEEEMIQRLTARYVSEFRAGQHPQLSEYLLRYPQYADMIADFVTYYHAIEVDIPREAEIIPALSQTSRAALEAWKNVLHADFEEYNTLNSLQTAAYHVHKSFLQLALEIGLSQDILQKLDLHSIDAATIPLELCHRLAKALQRPLAAIEIYLGLVEQKQLIQGLALAENPPVYHIEDQPDVLLCSFQEAVEQSNYMSDEQKGAWHTILVDEGLL